MTIAPLVAAELRAAIVRELATSQALLEIADKALGRALGDRPVLARLDVQAALVRGGVRILDEHALDVLAPLPREQRCSATSRRARVAALRCAAEAFRLAALELDAVALADPGPMLQLIEGGAL